ncbi:MAG TPA: peptidoglycan DD-metalloendopeptidase family protein [Bacteroidia bacterium]|jgi:murein DD-endopeptidase MepM/ murein hydrolase activator NlpD|nr:peptidoglycan DD-metalloendopeptidase family protein [Bacteroidia bacterium]
MIKSIFHTIIFLLLLAPAVAFSIDKGDKNKKPGDDKKRKKDDTTKVVSTSAITYDDVDSLLMFPSHDLYGSWDTASCHPDLFNQQFVGDSATIYLLDEWSCGFTMPKKGIITSEFGWRRRRPHYGTDINLNTGDTVMAAFDGKVRIARYIQGYGNVVIIRHNNGLETVYGHLSKILVQPEEPVVSGMTIGLGGNTGRSYGSHLHFEIRYLGKAIDTEDLIDYAKGEVKNNSFVLYKEDFEAKYNLRSIHAHKVTKSHSASRYVNVKTKGKAITVRNGDTLERIARRNHTTIENLCKKNGIKRTKVLQVGQKLKM